MHRIKCKGIYLHLVPFRVSADRRFAIEEEQGLQTIQGESVAEIHFEDASPCNGFEIPSTP